MLKTLAKDTHQKRRCGSAVGKRHSTKRLSALVRPTCPQHVQKDPFRRLDHQNGHMLSQAAWEADPTDLAAVQAMTLGCEIFWCRKTDEGRTAGQQT